MSIITVSSSNPNLSHILQKNPATIKDSGKPFTRSLRLGNIYAWFTSEKNDEFRILFKDADAENSFGNRQQFEYLDLNRYSNPYIPILAINAALNTAANKGHEFDVEGHACTVTFTIQCPVGILNRIAGLPGVVLAINQAADNHFKLNLTSDTVQKALNLTILVCVLACLADEDTYVPLKEEDVSKYLRVLNRAQAPYYLRHLFVSRAIQTRASFEHLHDLIQVPGMALKYGNTQVQRLDAIKEALPKTGSLGETLIDIGCGELSHATKLLDRYSSIMAYDGDLDIIEKNKARLARKQIENVAVFHQEVDADWIKENEGVFAGNDVLLSEVLEHRPAEDSRKLLQAILQTDCNRVVITVPCKEFNKFYSIPEGEFRHPDHKWEPSLGGFYAFVENVMLPVSKLGWVATVCKVGDTVTGEGKVEYPVSLMACFTKE